MALLPALLGWPYVELEPDQRKVFEVALHLGTAAALAIALRAEVAEVMRSLSSRRLLGMALGAAPPAALAYLLEDPIEQRLGSPRSVALAQIGGGLALMAADRGGARRGTGTAGALDHLLLGLGQAAALVPGVSRSGGALTALRLRGFGRGAAGRLARHAALPIILAASVQKAARLARNGLPPGLYAPFAAGATAAFVSTLASAPLIPLADGARSYRPYAVYRVGLGVVALAVLKRRGRATMRAE